MKKIILFIYIFNGIIRSAMAHRIGNEPPTLHRGRRGVLPMCGAESARSPFDATVVEIEVIASNGVAVLLVSIAALQ